MEKTNIKVNIKKCTQCHCCQLQCSFAYTGVFNPEKARIVVTPPNELSFTDECVAGCSLCVRYCPYGAIAR